MKTESRNRKQTLALGLMACLGALTLMLATGCPTNNPPPDNTNDNAIDNGNENTNDNTDPGAPKAFIGAQTCQLCHPGAHSDWAGTKHAGALDALKAIGQDRNAECLACHTVGFGQTDGFVSEADTPHLAGVQCESCHGAAGAHTRDPLNTALTPSVSLSASVCATCHQDPHVDDWSMSKHATVNPELVPRFASGTSLTSCGACHSGDYFVEAIVKGEEIGNDFLAGKEGDEMTGISCVVCHNPHAKTGNAATPADGRDYQLRFPQIKYTTPSTVLADATDPSRFNLCGQCHHSRERVWTDGSREPHPSDQANVFFGELPVPDSHPEPIVIPRSSVHLNTPEQCSTCHVYQTPRTETNPQISGHTFAVNYDSCASCHGTAEIGMAKLENLEIEIELRAELVEDALHEWALENDIEGKGELSWEYTSEGGPGADGQALIPDNIKKARYIYYYVIAGGGNGAHNPDFVRDALENALDFAETAPPAAEAP